MALQGVPWAVTGKNPDGSGGGALVPVEAARSLAHVAGGGREGVIGRGDFLVQPMDVPGAGVKVMPGVAVLTNRAPGGGQQAYLVRNDAATVVPITPTGSGGGRIDLVAVIVEDPQYPGQPAPADVVTGPYVRFAVYTNVPAGTTKLSQVAPNQTGLALARVNMAASDGTVELASIDNLLEVPQPRVGGLTRAWNKPNASASESLTTAAFSRFPDGAEWTITIPDWAVKASLELFVSGVRVVDDAVDGGDWRGSVRAVLDATGDGGDIIATESAEVNQNSVGPGRTDTIMFMSAQDVTVPKSSRGKKAKLRGEGLRIAATGGVDLRAAAGTTALLRVTFYEDVDTSFWIA